MPMKVTPVVSAGSDIYATPFVGPINHTAPVQVNIANLTTAEVDSQGYIKPGVPLTAAGALVGVAPAFVYGVTPEAIKLAKSNAVADRVGTFTVALATHGQVNRDLIEDILGRVLTADEIAGFSRAGSQITLIQ